MARAQTVFQTDRPFRPLNAAARRLAVAGRSCASCGSSQIRPSKHRNALDILLACLFLTPFRCRDCRDRFYRVWRPSMLHPPEPRLAPLVAVPPRGTAFILEPIEPQILPPEPAPTRKAEPQLIALPRPEPQAAEQNAPQVEDRPAKRSVLILESDLSIRKLLRRLLERRGYVTIEVAQSSDLSSELRDRRADLLIVDVSLPDTSLDAVLMATEPYSALKLLVLSEEKLDEKEIPGRLLALPKPFPLDRFVDSVDSLLEHPAS